MKIDSKGLLTKSTDTDPAISIRVKTDKTSGQFPNEDLPDTVVIHYTGGTTLAGAESTLIDPNVKASAHLLVDYNGDIVQLVPFKYIAWHAGTSKFNGRNGLNKFSIGIEIVNPGYLIEQADGRLKTEYSHVIDPANAEKRMHKNQSAERFWHNYTPEQIESVEKICFALKSNYKIKYIVGHDEIAPRRKQDPGPCFPIERLRTSIFDLRSLDEDEYPDTGVVTVDNLNIRADAEATASKIAQPLKKDALVEIIEKKDGWYKVKTEITGWVSAKYIG